MDEISDFDLIPDVNEGHDIQPYQYEPVATSPAASDSDTGSSTSESDESFELAQGRVGNTEWWVSVLTLVKNKYFRKF